MVTESADPGPVRLVVAGLQVAFELLKLGEGFGAVVLVADVDLVVGSHVVKGLGVAIELLLAEEAVDLRVLSLVLRLDVGAGKSDRC